MRLTKANLPKIVLPDGKSEAIVFDDDMPGFGVRIRAGGKRTWIAQYRFGSKQRRVTLGAVGTLLPELARSEAAKLLSAVTLGRDPQTEKLVARQMAAVTLAAVVPLYLDHARAHQRQAYHADVARYLTVHWAPIADLPLEKITRALVAKHLGEMSKSRGVHSADRARANLSAFFGWAIGEGMAAGNPVVGTNRPAGPVARDRVLTDEELRLVWHSVAPGDFGTIVRLLILTACRREEVAAMNRSEHVGDVWTIPGERTKNGLPHELPLPQKAVAILEDVQLRNSRDRIFGGREGGFSGWSKSKARLDARMLETLRKEDASAEIEPWRLHDLRRTAATRLGDLGVLPHVVEATLNHISGSRAGIAGRYNKAIYREEKRSALQLWADRVSEIVGASA